MHTRSHAHALTRTHAYEGPYRTLFRISMHIHTWNQTHSHTILKTSHTYKWKALVTTSGTFYIDYWNAFTHTSKMCSYTQLNSLSHTHVREIFTYYTENLRHVCVSLICVWGFQYSMWMVSYVCVWEDIFQLCIWEHFTSMCESISVKTDGVSVETDGVSVETEGVSV